MDFKKKIWKVTDRLSAVEMNRIENGIEKNYNELNHLMDLSESIQTKLQEPYLTFGPKHLKAGNLHAGYYGVLNQSEFDPIIINGVEGAFSSARLSLAVGYTQGLVRNSINWLKYSWRGKTLFIPTSPIRGGVSWEELYISGLVYGTGEAISSAEKFMLESASTQWDSSTRVPQDKKVQIGEYMFKVRLIHGLNTNPASINNREEVIGKDNEWDNLLLPLHEDAPGGFHGDHMPNILDWKSATPNGLGFNNSGLGVGTNGFSRTFTQNVSSSDAKVVFLRGEARSLNGTSTLTNTDGAILTMYAWRPVLELITE